MSDVRQAFDELQAFVANYDPISLLSQLTLTFLFVPEDKFQSEASEVVIWQRRIEFLTAFLLVRAYPPESALTVDGEVLEELEELLERYFVAVDRQLLFEVVGNDQFSEKEMILARAKIESLHVRGDAYPHQFFAFAEALYCPHDVWFREHLGFTIAEAINLTRAIEKECGERFNKSAQRARTEAHRQASELVANNIATEDQRSDLINRIACALHFGQAESLLAFTKDELCEFSGIPAKTSERFLRRMSQEFGFRNPSFPNSFTDSATAPWDYNTLNERPIVTRNGKYWLFVGPLLRSALFTTFFFDFLADNSYWPTFKRERGIFLEKATANYLSRIFPAEMTILNPLYPNGEEMADVMVLHDHKIILIQCKSKVLTYRSRIGADFEALRDDIKKAIANSFEQGIRARDYLEANDEAKFTTEGKTFAIDMSQVNGLYLVSVTSMPFQTHAARLANTNSILALFPHDDYPWSLSLGDLDVITQVLRSPAQFLHYLLRRRQVEKTSFQIHADEMDYLGFYLSQGLRFDAKDFEGMDSVSLSGFSDDLDQWVFEKFERNQNIAHPRASSPNRFFEFLADVERTSDDYCTDCALALLDLSQMGRKQFMEMVAQTKERSLHDKKLHSFSAVLEGGKQGHSFLSFDSKADRDQLFRQVAAFAMLKKYASRCEHWIGFGWDIASGREVDVSFFISQEWIHDSQMDELVREKLSGSHRVDP